MSRPVSNEDVLRAILEIGGGLHREFDELKQVLSQNSRDSAHIKLEDARLLTRELEELSRHILNTKKEIAMIRGGDEALPDRISSANFELDAIVKHTEDATNGIMTAAEEIGDIAGRLRNAIADENDIQNLEDINARVISIFEHCNFQDITGQRISKVIKTLGYIETRLENMLQIWGDGRDEKMAVAIDATEPTEADLLNGPQLPGTAVSQSEIDDMFGSPTPPAE